MSTWNQNTIQRKINNLESRRSSGGSASLEVVQGPPTIRGSESEGDLAFDAVNDNLYVFTQNNFVLTADRVFVVYALNVVNRDDDGMVSSAGDVTGFSTSPVGASSVSLTWEGRLVSTSPMKPTDPTLYVWTSTEGAAGENAITTIIEEVSGSSSMTNNTGSVTFKAFLLVGGTKQPDEGVGNSRINSYEWSYAPDGSTSSTIITNGTIDEVTGNTLNTQTGTTLQAFNHYSIIVEADGTALGTTTGGGATFTAEIDYT